MKVLQLWVLPGHGLQTYPAVREQLREFLREHPDVQVEVTVRTPGSLWSQLFSRLKRPRDAPRPHVVEIPGHWTATLANLGLLEDLSELAPDLSLVAWHPALHAHCRAASPRTGAGEPGGTGRDGDGLEAEAGEGDPARRRGDARAESSDGGLRSLPWWMEVPVLYYRPDLLRKAGLEADSLASWSSLREVCRALSRRLPASVFPIANGNPRESVSLADVAPAVWSRGGDFFSRDGSRSVFHREEAYHGIRSYLELLEHGWMPLLGKSGLVPPTLFEGGAALQFCGRLPRGKGGGGPRLAALPCPKGERAQAGVLVGHHLALLRGAGLTQEALGLLKFLTRPAHAGRYAATLGALPCAVAELEATLAAADELGRAFRTAVAHARPLPDLGSLGTLERIFDRSMENLIRAILRRSYDSELLRQELIYAAAEMDYILSMVPC